MDEKTRGSTRGPEIHGGGDVLHQETLIQTLPAVCSPVAVTKTSVSFRRLECSHTPDDSHQTSWKLLPDRQNNAAPRDRHTAESSLRTRSPESV